MKVSARIGAIEIAGDEVRIAIVKTGGRLPKVIELRRARAIYADEGDRREALVAATKDALSQVKSQPALFVLCVSGAWTIARQLTIPFKGARRVAAAVQFELEPYLAFPVEELLIDHLVVREIDGETHTLVVGLRREVVEDQLGLLAAAGLSVEGIGIDSIGAAALWSMRQGNAQGCHAHLHVRPESASIAIVNDRCLALTRHLSTGAARVLEHPAATAREVRNILRAFCAGWKGGIEVASLTVSGVAMFDDDRRLFETELGTPLRFGDMVSGLPGVVADESPPGEIDAQWGGSVGVAAAMAGGPFKLEFQQDGLAGAGAKRGMLGHVVFSCVLVLIALAGYTGLEYVGHRDNLAQVERLGEQVWTVLGETYPAAEAAKARPAGDIGGFKSLKALEDAVEEESRMSQSYSVDTFRKPSMLDVLAELAKHLPSEKASIKNLKIQGVGGFEIRVSGEIVDGAAFSEAYENLKQSAVIKVKPDGLNRSSSEGKQTFDISATNQE